MRRVSLLIGLITALGLVLVACSDDDGQQDQEICNDLVDNDGDGLNNCADPDCANDPACTAVCGNNTCDPGETPTSCPADCPNVVCGNGTCEAGEDATTCPQDCGATCGNGTCDAGEDATSCPQDCGGCDGVCSEVDDLIAQCGCQTGEMCTIIDQNGNLGCYAEGATQDYQPCTYIDDCHAGTICVGQPSTCLPFCDLNGGTCPGAGQCVVSVPTAAGNVGVCAPPDNCDLVTAGGCDTGQGCYLMPSGDTMCITAGTGVAGDPCSYLNDCGIGLTCGGQPPNAACVELCRGDTDCTTGTCQQIGAVTTVPPNDDVGVCQ